MRIKKTKNILTPSRFSSQLFNIQHFLNMCVMLSETWLRDASIPLPNHRESFFSHSCAFVITPKWSFALRLCKVIFKRSVCADDRILCVENPKDSTKNLLEAMHEFRKVAWYKANVLKSVAFSYISSDLSEREAKEAAPFTIATTTTQVWEE